MLGKIFRTIIDVATLPVEVVKDVATLGTEKIHSGQTFTSKKLEEMKILNLYAGIGGNRKLWGNKHEIVAVENDPLIAKIYQDFFPKDKVIVGDAHQYLLDHYKEFDFIWSSPPCPTHSRIRIATSGDYKGNGQHDPMFPDMKLYEEILFLQGYFKGKWCVENVIAWYDPLIPPNKMADHYFWTNFILRDFAGGVGIMKGVLKVCNELKDWIFQNIRVLIKENYYEIA